MKFMPTACQFCCSLLVVAALPLVAHAGPPTGSSEEYEKWVKEQYLPQQQATEQNKENQVKGQVQGWASGDQEPDNWRGTTEQRAQEISEWDELNIKDGQFQQCNDNRIEEWGDPEARAPKPCQEERGFFDKPNAIPFMCPLGIFGNDCGSDEDTGFELSLLCASDPGACGVHFDNRHPGLGGVIGIGIISKEPSSFPPCDFIYVTGSYVEYYFPWMNLNTSRQMYQSSYLVKDVSEDLRQTGHDRLRTMAAIETGNSVQLVAESANNAVKALLGEKMKDAKPVQNPNAGNIAQDAANAVFNVDDKLLDVAPHGSQQYTRNFSSTLDIRFQQTVYWYVPHYPLDTHRFGSEFPDLSRPVDIPMPTGTYEPLDLAELPLEPYRGGLLHGRFLSLSSKTGARLSQKLPANIQRLITNAGAFHCIANDKATGKTPQDFMPLVGATKDRERFCIDRVGVRFPFVASSFSPHDTDSFWRGLLAGGLDMFYALNWPTAYDADPQGLKALAIIPPNYGVGEGESTPFHTYFDDYDRVALSPNPDSSDKNFINEVSQCGRVQDIADYNVNYTHSNEHEPLWGAQNTAYAYGLVKGVWAFRGQVPLYTLDFGNSRYPDIEYRFR